MPALCKITFYALIEETVSMCRSCEGFVTSEACLNWMTAFPFCYSLFHRPTFLSLFFIISFKPFSVFYVFFTVEHTKQGSTVKKTDCRRIKKNKQINKNQSKTRFCLNL